VSNLEAVRKGSQGYDLVIARETVNVPYEHIQLLFASADLLLYPSFYEGFGLPILEAMASGTPVITSNISSMPEVAGEAALLVDPKDTDQIKKAVAEVMNDQNLRNQLIKKGLKNAQKFSWDKCAKETATSYKSLLK
jgi:glycosyltransferase involved in cell wall biosynthesis